ncbi:MAG: hypothetical protein U0802_13590 [Candidatus Binatia bacterium]
MTAWRQRVTGLAGAAVLAALAWLVFRPAPVRVEVGRVARGRLVVTVDEEGETRVRDRFVVTAPIAGRVARLALDPGDPVQQGTVVAHAPGAARSAHPRRGRGAVGGGAGGGARGDGTGRQRARRARTGAAQRGARGSSASGTIGKQEQELAELEETTRGKELEAAQFAERAAAATWRRRARR